jgi:hypothetical protein
MSIDYKTTRVVIFVYNRPDKTILLLNALQKSGIKSFTVFADGPKPNESIEKIIEVRKQLNRIDWAEIEIFEQEKNIGLANSVIGGVTKTFESGYEQAIILEDDCIPYRSFFKFATNALTHYKNEKQVMHISGFGLPLIMKSKEDAYFTAYPCSWGWATWKDRWEKCNFEDLTNYEKILKSSDLLKNFNKFGSAFSNFLAMQLSGKIDSWLIRWYVHIFLNNGICLWSKDSHIFNKGFYGQGFHQVKFDRFNQKFDESILIKNFEFPPPINISSWGLIEFRRYFINSTILERIKTVLYLILKKIVHLFYS